MPCALIKPNGNIVCMPIGSKVVPFRESSAFKLHEPRGKVTPRSRSTRLAEPRSRSVPYRGRKPVRGESLGIFLFMATRLTVP